MASSRDRVIKRGEARTALLNAAHELVRRQGWAATSVDQLCTLAGVTKGAFFHHFESKEALGIAAARHWTDVTAPLFAAAPYHAHADPLDRILAYLDFRADIAQGELEQITCFAGTLVQETFATSEPMRTACGAAIADHAATLEPDFAALIARRPPDPSLTASSLAQFTQTVLQGGFVLSKARGDPSPLLDAISHLKRYVSHLFDREHTP